VISRHDGLSFYELETARPALSAAKRRLFTDPDTGDFTEKQLSVSYVVFTSSDMLHDSDHRIRWMSL